MRISTLSARSSDTVGRWLAAIGSSRSAYLRCGRNSARRCRLGRCGCAQICRDAHEQKAGEPLERETYLEVVWRIVEDAYWLNIKDSTATEETSFANLVMQLMRICPELGSSLRERLGTRPSPLPMRFASDLWSLHLAIRCVP
jgi:hypothetical protein